MCALVIRTRRGGGREFNASYIEFLSALRYITENQTVLTKKQNGGASFLLFSSVSLSAPCYYPKCHSTLQLAIT